MRWPRMFTTDGHQFDTQAERIDIRRVCRTVAESFGTLYRLTAHTYMGYVYYDSKYGLKAPGLGTQDWFAEAREACYRYGIKLIGYFNFDGYMPDNPHYGKFDGKGEKGNVLAWHTGGFRAACLNWPGWRDLMISLIDEAVRKYTLDGVYTDWMGYFTCYCDQCRRRFQAECEIPIPDSGTLGRSAVPFNYPGFDEGEDLITDSTAKKYAKWKSNLTSQMIKEIFDTARSVKPDVLVMHHMHPNRRTIAYYDGTLTEGGERNRPDWVWRVGNLANASNVYTKPVFVNLYSNVGIPREEYKLRAAQVVANGCYPNVIPVPLPDSRTLAGAAEIFRVIENNKEYFDFRITEQVRFLAMPCSPTSYGLIRDELVARRNPLGVDGRLGKMVISGGRTELVGLDGKPLETHSGVRGWPSTEVQRLSSPRSGMYGALALSGIPVCSVHREHFLEQFRDFGVLCLANEASMSDAEVQRVREFVRDGGGLVATHETSLYCEDGSRRVDFGLSDVLGIRYPASDRYLGALGDYELHFVVKVQHPVNEGMPVGIRIRNCELVVPVSLVGAQTLVSAVKPNERNYVDEGSGHIGTLRESLMGGQELSPAITVHEFGRGRVVYFAGRPDSMYLHWAIPEMRAWLRNAVDWVAHGRLPVRLETEAPLSASLFRQPKRYILHLVNFSERATPVDHIPVLHDIRLVVEIPLNVNVRRVRAIVSGKDVEFRQTKEQVHFALPEVHEYEAVAIEHAG